MAKFGVASEDRERRRPLGSGKSIRSGEREGGVVSVSSRASKLGEMHAHTSRCRVQVLVGVVLAPAGQAEEGVGDVVHEFAHLASLDSPIAMSTGRS